ncbi:hypothetical protein SNEBB_008361 [Seison nebaliae]|nr:hypothetical protein SNEBB_008361 [Seison nebaliae]
MLAIRRQVHRIFSTSAIVNKIPKQGDNMRQTTDEPKTNSAPEGLNDDIPGFTPTRGPRSWPRYNRIIYPPNLPEQPARYVNHMKMNIHMAPKKMWFAARLIRGMTIDEAIKQLSFYGKGSGQIIKDILIEAQEKAVNEHNIEFKSNLWISNSFVGRALIMKTMRKHMGNRFGIIHYRHSHYFVRLEEGKPPLNYYPTLPTKEERVEFLHEIHRNKRILSSL